MQNNKSVNKITVGLYGWWTIQNLDIDTDIDTKPNDNNIQTVTGYSATGWLMRATETHLPHTYHANSIALATQMRELWQQSPMKNLIVFIYGEQGTGKTKSGIYLSKLIGATVYKDFIIANERRVQSTVNDVFDNVQSNTNTPVVLIWDEIDDYLFPAVNGTVEFGNYSITQQNQQARCKVPKPTWNSFLDYISTRRNVILIITSNKNKKVFDDYDVSLLRQHRVNYVFECRSNGVEEISWSTPIPIRDEDSDTSIVESPVKPGAPPTTSTSKNELWSYFGGN